MRIWLRIDDRFWFWLTSGKDEQKTYCPCHMTEEV